ncbi:hypothetical protein SEMRO_2179_G317920.1 [Seminavis robusta]|uniref:Uncharacterized protein n=1 Tax=Seminavis robusta TaxID=568900 RepID=A0A9N8EYX2_9STRA|nr:hypothetical protein SEMRO_2179_G317920.1 [Seminavis robusta]|eukprot:Sro2179_g317920.1 n/a (157) ;mRNA; f:5507-5977
MRRSLQDPAPLLNSSNTYQQKVFVRVLDPDETSESDLLAALQVVQRFLQKAENNRYGTKVFIRQPGWNLTSTEPSPLRKIDHVLQYSEIVRLMNSLFDNVNASWAINNMETASLFFTEGHIPFEAINDLGFPVDAVNNNMVANVPPLLLLDFPPWC